jgi:general secretion pathway protein L
MAQRILGLDVGANSVKAVLLEGTFRGYAVARTARVPLAGAGDGATLAARQAAAVRALLSEGGLGFDVAVVAFPGASVSSHLVTLPFIDPRRIEQTIGFEVEGQIPFDLADVAWDWQPLGTRDGKTDLLVAVVRKEELAALVGALGEAGVDPRAVLPASRAAMVGDSLAHDVDGARRVGMRGILLARAGEPPPVADGVDVIRSLAELPRLL